MSHKSIRLLIRDTAKSLRDDIQYTYARPSDFNVLRDKQYPFITLDPLSATPSFATDGAYNFEKAWQANMAFYQLDSPNSNPEETAEILDLMDNLVDQFIIKLNFYMQDSDKILIAGMSQQPAIKVMADVITGYVVTLTLQVQDDFDYCANDC